MWGDWTERLSYLLSVKKVLTGRAEAWTYLSWLQSLHPLRPGNRAYSLLRVARGPCTCGFMRGWLWRRLCLCGKEDPPWLAWSCCFLSWNANTRWVDIESAIFPMILWVAVVSLSSCGPGWSHPERMGMTWVLGRQEYWELQLNIEPGCFRERKMHAQLSSPGRSRMSGLWQRGYKQGLWIQTALGWDPRSIVYLLCNLEQLI